MPITAHPYRTFMSAAQKTRMQADAIANTTRWAALKIVADNTVTNDTTHVDSYGMVACAVAYQAAAGASHGTQAVATLVNLVATNLPISGGGQYYDARWVFLNMGFTFDLMYGSLTSGQRNTVATWLMDKCDEVWPETNPARIGAWAVHDPYDNYYYGFLYSWMCAAAAYGDDTGTGAVSGANRPLYHLTTLGYTTKYLGEVLPAITSLGAGADLEGTTSYDQYNLKNLARQAQMYGNCGLGSDLTNGSAQAFLKAAISISIHGTTPDLNYYYPEGDQALAANAAMNWYHREAILTQLATLNDTALIGKAKWWLDHLPIGIASTSSSYNATLPWEFLYYDPAITAVDYTATEPLSYFASGKGLLLKRSDWTSLATYWGIWCGALHQSHQFKNALGFRVWKGGWLVGDASQWSASGIEQASISQGAPRFGTASVLTNPTPAGWQEEGGFGVVGVNEVTTQYTYFRGEAHDCYTFDRSHGGTPVASDVTRKFVYVDGLNAFVVYDRSTLLPAYVSLTKNQPFHSLNNPTIAGKHFAFDNGTYKCDGFSLYPANTTLTVVPLNLGPASALSSYRTDVTVNNNQATDQTLTVLEISTLAASVFTPTYLTTDQGNMMGASLNGWVVLVGVTDLVTGTISYSVNQSGVSEHLLTDLTPSTAYIVSITGHADIQASTSSAGSLRFQAAPGPRTISIVAGTVGAGGGGGNTTPGVIIQMGYPQEGDLHNYLVGAGLRLDALPLNQRVLDLTGTLAAAITDWEIATKYEPFLSSGADTTKKFSQGDILYARHGRPGENYPMLDLVGGFLSVTSLKINVTPTNTDGTTLVQDTDYFLMPANAPNKNRPYTWIEFYPYSQQGLFTGYDIGGAISTIYPNSIRVTGKEGFSLTVPSFAFQAILQRAFVILAPQMSIAISGGLLSWKEADATSETYGAHPLAAIADAMQANYLRNVKLLPPRMSL